MKKVIALIVCQGLASFTCCEALALEVNLPLFDVSLRRSIMRLSSAVPRPSVSQTASD